MSTQHTLGLWHRPRSYGLFAYITSDTNSTGWRSCCQLTFMKNISLNILDSA